MRVTPLLCFMFQRGCVRRCLEGKLADEENRPPHHHRLFFSFQRKCDQYWPERGTRNYGQVQVTLKETLNMSHYTVRKLVMTHKMVS